MIAVAATNRTGNRAYYSNYGSVVDISAPGGETSSCDQQRRAFDAQHGNPGAWPTYVYYQGTSMATPHVAGVASLVLSVKPSLTPAQVLQVLQDTARRLSSRRYVYHFQLWRRHCGRRRSGERRKPTGCQYRQARHRQRLPAPGDRITFTLSIANNGGSVAASVIVTDLVPSQVLNPTFASSLTITRTGVLSYVWNVGTLGVGQSGVITVYGRLTPARPAISHSPISRPSRTWRMIRRATTLAV